MTILEENGRWKEEKKIEGGTKRERGGERDMSREDRERDGEGTQNERRR